MALIETYARLCGSAVTTPPWSQDVTATAFSTNAYDLGANRTGKTLGGGQLIVARFGVTTALTDAATDTLIDLQICNCNGSTGPVAPTAAAATNVNITTNTVTSTAHGLANGTPVVMTTTTAVIVFTPVAYTAGQFLYVRNATADTFQLSYTPGGALLDFSGTGTGTQTFTELLTTLCAAPGVALQRLGAGCFLELAVPPPSVAPESFAGRYLLARFVPSTGLSTGVMTCDLVSGFSMDRQPLNRIGYVTA